MYKLWNGKVEWKSPRFKPTLWNVYTRVLGEVARTNNFSEAWHSAFSATVNCNPGIYELVDALRTEQDTVDDKLVKLVTGSIISRNLKYFENPI